jgi:histidinol-phosphate aminotransferase
MPRFNPSVLEIQRYKPGVPAEVIAAEYGIDEVIKLASNEYSGGPFPGVVEAALAAAAHPERYPDNSVGALRSALAEVHGIGVDNIFVGAGSSGVLQAIAMSAGGPSTSAVYPWPSFVLYEILSQISGTQAIRVPLDSEHRLDLKKMAESIRDDTTLLYICNPNNPTGTYRSYRDILSLTEEVDDTTLIVVDEAYAEFADADDYGSFLAVASQQPNLIVMRTFSKIHALAGFRVGYAVGHPDTLDAVSRAQRPFTVTALAQAAALESLKHDLTDRRAETVAGRAAIEVGLARLGLNYAPSQANFVWFDSSVDGAEMFQRMAARGVVVRNYGQGTWSRVTVGNPDENRAFLAALEGALGADSG